MASKYFTVNYAKLTMEIKLEDIKQSFIDPTLDFNKRLNAQSLN